MDWLRPTKISSFLFVLLGFLYSFFLLIRIFSCNAVGLICTEKPRHNVLNIFPGSTSCQICATTPELIFGYIMMILLYFILPFIIIYLISSLVNLSKKNN